MTDASRAGDTLRDAAESLRMPRSLFDEPFLLNLLEPVSDGVAIVGTAGDIVLVNAQIETLFGYTRDELLGGPFEMLLAERFRTKCDAPQVSASDAGRVADTRRGRDCYGLHRNGDEFPVEMRLSPITMPDGESLACWSLRDVSEGKRAQVFEATREQIRQAQKLDAVGQLAGGVAHNFNNLLTAILGYAELLMLRDDMDDLARHDLEEIKKAGKRAAMLARQLLAFSRKHTPPPQDVDLNRAVADLEPMIRNLIRENITLTCRLAPRPAVVRIDPSEIEQVLLNLILNARDALVSGGHIRIEIDNAPSWPSELGSSPHQPSADRVALRVIDDGTGIAPDVRAHLFEPFFTTKGVGNGIGLGLASVYGVVQHNHGTISIDSEVGCGTTFTMHFPAVAVPPPSAPESLSGPAMRVGRCVGGRGASVSGAARPRTGVLLPSTAL